MLLLAACAWRRRPAAPAADKAPARPDATPPVAQPADNVGDQGGRQWVQPATDSARQELPAAAAEQSANASQVHIALTVRSDAGGANERGVADQLHTGVRRKYAHAMGINTRSLMSVGLHGLDSSSVLMPMCWHKAAVVCTHFSHSAGATYTPASNGGLVRQMSRCSSGGVLAVVSGDSVPLPHAAQPLAPASLVPGARGDEHSATGAWPCPEPSHAPLPSAQMAGALQQQEQLVAAGGEPVGQALSIPESSYRPVRLLAFVDSSQGHSVAQPNRSSVEPEGPLLSGAPGAVNAYMMRSSSLASSGVAGGGGGGGGGGNSNVLTSGGVVPVTLSLPTLNASGIAPGPGTGATAVVVPSSQGSVIRAHDALQLVPLESEDSTAFAFENLAGPSTNLTPHMQARPQGHSHFTNCYAMIANPSVCAMCMACASMCNPRTLCVDADGWSIERGG